MTRAIGLSIALAAASSGALVAMPARADVSVNVNVGVPPPPPPIVVPAPPRVVVVPGSPVYYAPDVSVNLFFFEKRYYTLHNGHLFWGRSHNGPWTFVVVEKVPRPVLAVPVRYYKIPPGHAKKLGGEHPGKGHGHGKGPKP